MTSPAHIVGSAIVLCLVGAVLTRLCGRSRHACGWLAMAATAASSALIWMAAARTLLAGPAPAVPFVQLPEWNLALRFYIDGLSAIFLGLAATVAFFAALYSPAYLRHPAYQRYSAGRYHSNFLLFLAGMYGLLSTTDMLWFFFLFWQLMTLPSYALIRFEHDKPDCVRAANRYLWMMQLACTLAVLGALILTGGPVVTPAGESLVAGDFDAVSHHLPAMLAEHGGLVALAFACFLAGFGIKLGMWPFGPLWLPDAHPAAPSPVSALLSGVMIKTGVYGLLRCFLWLVPQESLALFPAAEWGLTIALLGTASLFLGTARALGQDQTKRLLAYSSIGQGGYILLAIGATLALLGPAQERPATLASLTLAAALFHTVNHGLFKSLLFLTAGSLWYRAETQDLNRMGGWMRRLPWTGLAALVASLSIAGVPLTNGFASKWCLASASLSGSAWAAWLPACAAIAILTSTLTLAVFVKYFGAAFLARPRQQPGTTARSLSQTQRELPPTMLLAQLLPAALCIALGLLPGLAFHGIALALQASQQGLAVELARNLAFEGSWNHGLTLLDGAATLVPLPLALLFALFLLLALALAAAGGARRRVAEPWLCGYARAEDCPTHAARNYCGSLKAWFAPLGTPSWSRPAMRNPNPPPNAERAPGILPEPDAPIDS